MKPQPQPKACNYHRPIRYQDPRYGQKEICSKCGQTLKTIPPPVTNSWVRMG